MNDLELQFKRETGLKAFRVIETEVCLYEDTEVYLYEDTDVHGIGPEAATYTLAADQTLEVEIDTEDLKDQIPYITWLEEQLTKAHA